MKNQNYLTGLIALTFILAGIIIAILKAIGFPYISIWLICFLVFGPGLYASILICIGIYKAQRTLYIKSANGTFKAGDLVKYAAGIYPKEAGLLSKNNAIWFIEYIDGSQVYVFEFDKLIKAND